MSISTTYRVTGLTCGHCAAAVTQELSDLDGVTDVAVDLQPGAASLVVVRSREALPEDLVAAAIDEAGYQFAGVRRPG